MTWSKHLEDYHHMEKEDKKKGDDKHREGRALVVATCKWKQNFSYIYLANTTSVQQTSTPEGKTWLSLCDLK